MTDHETAPPGRRFGAGPYGVVALLVGASVLSYLDRAIMGLMVDPIRRDLHIGDVQIGILSGFAFAVFYAFLGLPFGRWADKNDRRALIVGAMVVWSAATAASGLVHGFISLFLARMLVGVGEAALGPAALSLIANLFPRRRLGFALALLATAITMGNGVAIYFGGMLVKWSQSASIALPGFGALGGWRLVFVVVGAAGLPAAALVGALVREPERQRGTVAPKLMELVEQIRGNVTAYGLIVAGYSLMVVMSFAQVMWGPTYFLRIHHMPVGQFAGYYGLLMGIGGTIGLLAGGAWSDAWTRRGVAAAPAKVNLIAVVLQIPFLVVGYLAKDLTVALIGYGVGVMVLCFTGGLQSATLQRITPHRMLGSITAIYLIFANLIGGGAGAYFIGLLSQTFSRSGGGLGQALAVMSVTTLPVAAALIVMALKPLALTERRLALDQDASLPPHPAHP